MLEMVAHNLDLKAGLVEKLSLRKAWQSIKPSSLGGNSSSQILFIPGNLSADKSTQSIREALEEIGYKTFPSGMVNGKKIDLTRECYDTLRSAIEEAVEKSGGHIALVGHSAGALIAAELAREFSQSVTKVIGVGAVFNFEEEVLAKAIPKGKDLETCKTILMNTPYFRIFNDLKSDFPRCPVVSIVSPGDEIVSDMRLSCSPRQNVTCVQVKRTNDDIINGREASSDNAGPSHVGLIYNAEVAMRIHQAMQGNSLAEPIF